MADQDIPTFTDDDTLEERIKKFEKANQGLVSDLQSERAKRHDLETRLAQVETSLTEAGNGEETNQDLINRLAQDPVGFIRDIVVAETEPVVKSVQQLRIEKRFDQAYSWIAKQEKKDVEDIYGSDVEKEIVRISKDHGMTSMDPLEGTRAAYKILQQERREKDSKEQDREVTIAGQSTETVRGAAGSGSLRFSRDTIARMSPAEFNANYAAIKQAEREGLIK